MSYEKLCFAYSYPPELLRRLAAKRFAAQIFCRRPKYKVPCPLWDPATWLAHPGMAVAAPSMSHEIARAISFKFFSTTSVTPNPTPTSQQNPAHDARHFMFVLSSEAPATCSISRSTNICDTPKIQLEQNYCFAAGSVFFTILLLFAPPLVPLTARARRFPSASV